MARAKAAASGRLQEAMTNLAQAQALLVRNQAALAIQKAKSNPRRAATQRLIAEAQRQRTEWERQAMDRIDRIEAILAEHTRLLRALPNAICEKIGFKPPEAGPSTR